MNERFGAGAEPPGALFADRCPDPSGQPTLRWLAGKATRFLARNVRTKGVRMRNVEPLVTFTFDDAPASSAELGAAILERHDIRGTFYISGAGCGRLSPNGVLANIGQIRTLLAAGHEIGCHTFTHPAVSTLSGETLEAEIGRNSAFLHANIGIVPRNFAFPYGDVCWRAKRYLETKFDSCRSDRRGVNARTLDLGMMRSCSLENASTHRARIMTVIRQTVRLRGWLIFSSHAVQLDPGRFAVTPDLLAFTAAAVKSEGCRPMTIAAGLEVVKGAGRRARPGPAHESISAKMLP